MSQCYFPLPNGFVDGHQMRERVLGVELLYGACAVVVELTLAIEAWTTKEALLGRALLWLGITVAIVLKMSVFET